MNIKKFTQKDRYGNSMSFEFEVPPMQEVPQGGGQHPGMPVGTDTVPAWLTPGEFVMNAEATRKFKPQLEAMNNHGRVQQKAQGGSIPSPAPVYKNQGGQVPGYQGNGMTGMAGGLMAMDPMMSMFMPTNNSAMDTMVQPQMVPQRQPMPNQMAPIAQGYAPLYRQGGGYIDPRAQQIDDETAMFLKQMEELRQQQNKPSIMQGFIPGNEQVPAGKMIGSKGVQTIPEKPAVQIPIYPEPVQAVPGQEGVMLVTQDGLPLNSDGQPFTNSKLTVPRNYDPSAPAQVEKEYSGRGSVGMPEANRGRGQGYEMRDKIIETTLGHEGGKANDPVDKGGKTNFGITQTTYNNMGFKGDVNDLTREKAKEFYNKYWDRFNIDSYPPHLQDQIFDMYTNHSPRGVAKILQRAAGVTDDGIVGPQTMAAIQNLDPNKLVESRKDYYEMIMENDPSQEKFRNGWMSRAESFRKGGDDNPQVPRGDEAVPQLSGEELARHMANLDNGVGKGVNIPGISSAEAGIYDKPTGTSSSPGIPEYNKKTGEGYTPQYVGPSVAGGRGVPATAAPVPKPQATPEEVKRQEYEQYLEEFNIMNPPSSFNPNPPQPLSYEEWGGGKPEESLRGGDTPEETPEGVHGTYEDYKAGQEALGNPVMSEENWKKSTGVGKPEFKEFPRSGLGSETKPTIEDVIEQTEKGLSEEELNLAISEDEALRAGEIEIAKRTDKGQVAMNGIKKFLNDWGIMDLFDKKEIGRMAALYLGSRALGHSHGGSLNWVAKQYLTRVDAKAANHDKQVAKWLEDGTFTKESIAEYKRTKDINDLQKPGVSYTPQGNSEYKLITVKGKDGKYSQQRVKVREMKGSDGGTYWQLPNGKNVDALLLDDDKPENVKGTDEYYAKNSRVRGDVMGTFTSELNLLDTENNRGNREGQTPRPVGFTPETAAEDYVAFARELGLDPESPFVRTMATNALHNAYKDALEGTKGRSYGEYLHQMFIRETTGATDNLSLGVDKNGREQFVDAALIGVLNRDLVVTARQKRRDKGLPEVSDQELRQTMYNSAMAAWGELGDDAKKEWDRKATDGETTGFYEFMKAKLLDFKVS